MDPACIIGDAVKVTEGIAGDVMTGTMAAAGILPAEVCAVPADVGMAVGYNVPVPSGTVVLRGTGAGAPVSAGTDARIPVDPAL